MKMRNSVALVYSRWTVAALFRKGISNLLPISEISGVVFLFFVFQGKHLSFQIFLLFIFLVTCFRRVLSLILSRFSDDIYCQVGFLFSRARTCRLDPDYHGGLAGDFCSGTCCASKSSVPDFRSLLAWLI